MEALIVSKLRELEQTETLVPEVNRLLEMKVNSSEVKIIPVAEDIPT